MCLAASVERAVEPAVDRLEHQSAATGTSRSSIVGIDHVQLAMPAGEEAAAQAFYEGLLGVPRVPKPPHLERRGGCWFECSLANGTVKIHLGVEETFHPARKAHPALLVDGLAALVERLRVAGVTVRDHEPLEGYDRVYVDDPFGNRLELMELIEPHT